MADKETIIETILNNLGTVLTFDRMQIQNILKESFDNYQIKYQNQDTIKIDLKEKIELYFDCQKISKTLNENSIYQYKLRLDKFSNITTKPVEKITTADIRLFLVSIQTKNKISMETLKTYIATLRSFFKFLIEEEYITKNPMNKIKMPKASRRLRIALNEEELEKLRNACISAREKALVEFIFSTACRCSEVSNVRISDIDFERKQLQVIGKGDKQRNVYFSSKCKLLLQAYINARGFINPYLFAASKKPHNFLSTESIEKEIRNIKSRTDIAKEVYPHILRHTWATLALRNGIPLDTIQAILGHSKITTTQIYAAEDSAKIEYECRRFLNLKGEI